LKFGAHICNYWISQVNNRFFRSGRCGSLNQHKELKKIV
jgi:hypothetical protein